jgi:hypothetical protein
VKAFEQFRRELADVCTVFINNTGETIGHSGLDCRCPLGVLTLAYHPGHLSAATAWGITPAEAAEFMAGFDGLRLSWDDSKYYRLGKLYRERFVGR